MTARNKLAKYGSMWGVDPKYHDSIFRAVDGLEALHGEPTIAELDEWFTVLYGLVLELEGVLECNREHVKVQTVFDDFLALPAEKPRINVDDLKHKSRDSWTDQYDL